MSARLRSALLLGLALLCSCKSASITGVIFTVDATTPLADIVRLRGSAVLDSGGSGMIDLPHQPAISIPDAITFALQLPDDATGMVTVHLEAVDSNDKTIAAGDGAATIIPHGVQRSATIMLQPVGSSGMGITLDSGMHDFGSVDLTQSAMFTFNATNVSGALSGAPMVTIDGPNGADFSYTTTCNLALDANATCMIVVTFTPTVSGPLSAAVHIAATPGGGATASLSGVGTTPTMPAFTLTPSTFQFMDTPETTTGDSTMFTLKNIGGAASPSLLSSVIAGGTASSYAITNDGCFAKTLAPNDTCTVTVQFTPGAAGLQASTLTAAGASAMLDGLGQGSFHAEGNMNSGPGAGTFWNGAYAVAPDQIFATTTGMAIYETAGGKPATFASYTTGATSATLGHVWGPARGSVYVVDSAGEILHWAGSGQAFSVFHTVGGGCCSGIWGSSDTDFYVVGGAAAAHYTGSWTAVTLPGSPALNSIWASSANNIYAVGNGGQIYYGTGGTSWTTVASGLSASTNLYSIFGNGPNNIYAVGFDFTVNPTPPIILHYDGVSWAANQTIPTAITSAKFNSVWVAPDGEAWISDLYGTILHSDGNGVWTNIGVAGDNTGKYQVFGTSDHDVYVFGEDGNIYHYY